MKMTVKIEDIEPHDEVCIGGGDIWYRVVRVSCMGVVFIKTPYGHSTMIPYSLITNHRKKPFDWSTAKTGMAFEDIYGDVCWYLMDSPTNKNKAILSEADKNILDYDDFYIQRKDKLTRAPEHDIKEWMDNDAPID